MTDIWNQRYATDEFAYGKEPNIVFKSFIDKIPTGTILFAAEGEGRNAVYAATRGWNVFAFDTSTAGKEKAEKLAMEKNVSIDYQIGSFSSFETGDNFFDCVAFVFSHLPSAIRKKDFRRLIQFLKSGGTLIVIGFSKSQLGKSSGGPKDLDMLFSEEQLRDDFQDLKNIKVQEFQMELNEGPFHQGLASLIQLTGVK